MKQVKSLLRKLNIRAHDLSLYEQAFTHSSFNADAGTVHKDYEKLEFLGDSVIGLVVAELSFENRDDLAQGTLTKLKAALVNTKALSNYARKLNFHEYIKVGNSFSGNVIESDHILEDVFEAFVGAIYLDIGFNRAKQFITYIFLEDIKSYNLEDLTDYKSRLQEEIQAEHRESVTYELLEEKGPPHDRTFKVRVLFDGMELGVGVGKTKRQAEQMAAMKALQKKA